MEGSATRIHSCEIEQPFNNDDELYQNEKQIQERCQTGSLASSTANNNTPFPTAKANGYSTITHHIQTSRAIYI